MADIYHLYKPLRNHMRQLGLIESLSVIRAYIQYMQFNKPISNDIEVHQKFRLADRRENRGIHEWELEILAKEIIINSTDISTARETFKKWDCLAGAVNKLKTLENDIVSTYPEGSILIEMYRIAHRQFPWQTPLNGIWLTRYFKIFSHPQLDAIIQRVLGISTQDLYTIGMAFTGVYLEYFSLNLAPDISIHGLTQEKFDRFINHFSLDIASLKKLTVESQQYNENYPYAFNPLRAYPLIRVNFQNKDSLISPLPPLLFRRFTEGVYYEICDERDFGEPFGESFQKYTGEVIDKSIRNSPLTVYPESEYYLGKERKDTIDWIVDEKGAALFVECKTKRISVAAKIEIISLDALIQQQEKMADFITQMYKTIRDYQSNLYHQYKFDKNRKIFPLVVTLEDWYFFGHKIEEELDAKIKERLIKAGIALDVLDEMPYSICAIHEFELMIQIMASTGIMRFMSQKVFDKERRRWPFSPFIYDIFSEERSKTKELFPEDFERITPIRDKPA